MQKPGILAGMLVLLLAAGSAHLPALAGEQLRVTIPFNADWLFFRGSVKGDSASAVSYNDKAWQPVHLPHSPKMLPLRQPWKPDNEGVNWYRKTFKLSEKYKGRKIFLEFEGADFQTDVWINGILQASHTGAFLPFHVDITETAFFGKRENRVAVRVDNFQNRDVPVYGAWISFGGLYRDVSLVIEDRLHISDALSMTFRPAAASLSRIRPSTILWPR